jgi:pimeloyl-ACP methyl ester carboxylesterase
VASAPIILVPGFWLGAWAWDDVVDTLRADGHDVTALTLPGLDSPETDRSGITFEDHVNEIVAAVKAAAGSVVLAVHSGAGASGYAASDCVPERIAAMVYVDSGPATAPLDPGFDGDDFPLPSWEDLDENLEGIGPEQLETFRNRSVPEPAGPMRESATLSNDARLDIPSIAICNAFTSDQYKEAVREGQTWLGGFADLRNLTWIDMPTSHWPMWSRPQDLAKAIGDVAENAGGGS